MERLGHIVEEASLYLDEIASDERYGFRICLEILDTVEAVTLVLDDGISVEEGSSDPDLKFSMERSVFERLVEGEADAFAMAARSSPEEKRPIKFEIYKEERWAELFDAALAIATYLFLPGRVKMKRFLPELAGQAHGARPIPIVYWNGMRSAWYFLGAGETLNERGERDPWPQVLIPLSGLGRARIGEDEFDIRLKTAIYVPRDTVHQVEAVEDMEILWLAWNAPPM